MNYTQKQILDIVNTQLPLWIKRDEAVKEAVLFLVNVKFETKTDSEDKFTKMLNEIIKDREEQTKKWDEQKAEAQKKWDEQKAEAKKDRDDNKKQFEKTLGKIDLQNKIIDHG